MFNQKQIKHERKPNRKKGYDYSGNGFYFVTICIKDRLNYFREVKKGKMRLNECGVIVKERWLWLKKQYIYVKLDEFIIMPNHVHGILVIQNDVVNINTPRRDNPRIVPTGGEKIGDEKTELYKRRHNLLSKTINAFKTTASIQIHDIGLFDFLWQRSFYDHIIRNEKSLYNIRRYIRNNPLKWELEKDRNHHSNIEF